MMIFAMTPTTITAGIAGGNRIMQPMAAVQNATLTGVILSLRSGAPRQFAWRLRVVNGAPARPQAGCGAAPLDFKPPRCYNGRKAGR